MKNKILLLATIILGLQSAHAASKDTSLTLKNTKPQPKLGVNVEPLWWAVGGVGAKFEYFTTQRMSIGVSGIFIPEHQKEKSSSDTVDASNNYKWAYNEINLGTNIMLSGTITTSGAYINPAVGYSSSRITDYSTFKLQGSLSTPHARLTGGYQWILDTGLRFGAGGGLKVAQSSDIVIKDQFGAEVYREKSSTLSGLALDLHVGYVF